MQDSKGYVWFGTQAGLTRYDGKEFVNFTSAKEIPGIFSRYIMEDHTGAIWFSFSGFSRGGIMRFRDRDTTDFSDAILGTVPICLAEDWNHDVWVGTNVGLTRITFTDPLRTTWITEKFPEYHTRSLLVDSKGALWIACSNDTVFTYDSGKFSVVATGVSTYLRPYAVQDRGGTVWFGGLSGAFAIENGIMHSYSIADGLPTRGVWSFCEDRYGNFWVGTARGLYRMRTAGGRPQFFRENSFGDAIVYDMCLDAEGNVWIASDPGLRKLIASDLIVDFPGQEKLASAGFGPMAQSPDGTIYFGSRNTGIFSLRGNTLRIGSQVQPFTDFTVLSVLPQSDTKMWFGIKSGGIILQDGAVTYQYPDSARRPTWSVYSLSLLKDGEILMGTARGLYVVDTALSVRRSNHPDIDSLVVFDIATDGTRIWLGTDDGVFTAKIVGDSILEVQRPPYEPLHSCIVYTILVDNKGHAWFGTDGKGLALFDGSSFRTFKREDGLAGNRVYALAQDSIGLIWIGTSSGLSQFDGSSFRSFTFEHGFGEIGLHGLMTDREGYLWVSSFPGITKIRPQWFYKSTRPPPIYISDMQVLGEGIELDPNPAVITFRFAGLSLTDEANVRYEYKLEGFDENWSAPAVNREVRYTHLTNGRYNFLVKARSADGIWSESPATISFSILPPVWARWWFILAAVVLLISAIYAFYRYRLEKALQLERTRSRIAMDLHDDIGSSLTRISVLSEVARRQELTQPSASLDTLATIGDTARNLIDSLSDIVWSVDPKHDDLQNVIRRIVQFGEETCAGRGIEFETDLTGDLTNIKLSLEQRRDVFLIFKEAINNAVKHSRSTKVVFKVAPDRSAVVLELVDDGIGFDANSESTGNGLASMRERGNRVGGCTIGSAPGRGTTISARVKTG
jgi:ligand-binding sensor domain-containing protein/signal transduction histidine kinase